MTIPDNNEVSRHLKALGIFKKVVVVLMYLLLVVYFFVLVPNFDSEFSMWAIFLGFLYVCPILIILLVTLNIVSWREKKYKALLGEIKEDENFPRWVSFVVLLVLIIVLGYAFYLLNVGSKI